MYRILIIEDDLNLSALLKSYIEKYEFHPVVAEDFVHIMDIFHNIQPHLVLLDINLPKFDGYYWCRQIRLVSKCPILFISARSEKMDQVMALDNGADDFITKPFHQEVVMAKIRSHLRRAYGEFAMNERIIELSGLKLYPERFEMKWGNKRVPLTRKEAAALEILLKRFPRVVSRNMLLEKLWDDNTFVDENTLNVNITRLRKKLQELGIEHAIESVRGEGYRFLITWETGETWERP
ncbi:response regulator transcription factor [Lihuaxuella thermophila]|uniref:DNA-binding response regulator, OmpR family, contains REC and winged-helix (WHTH) domain n=1 Tax=Lihuaxuella thermophila TaxID=1173111 RepID=A0A1H8J4L2_9BACL|nr:response regulator transcription factor [Lihuaxuella thermophila]SEN75599.1 DNA-binding response regulator, OmpR family, contains REC and winged-helix (wHTH) domain [Lihuaxuella thermophila]